MSVSELSGPFLVPSGTNKVLNMPYACADSEICAPYRVKLLPGVYEIELWGGSGGDTESMFSGTAFGGLAGYVKGSLDTENPLVLYFYVGARGYSTTTSSYNGGGLGPELSSSQGIGAGGGGSSDVRLTPSLFDEDSSLKSRFMVAGAGGGACSYRYGIRGGNNLGVVGEQGQLAILQGYVPGIAPFGGNQTTPGKGYIAPTNYGFNGSSGALGKGGDSTIRTGAGSGGSGFYGGGSGGWSDGVVSSGAAGSSFVSGHEDCPKIEGLPVISNITILKGTDPMLSPLGIDETGHSGNGFARITVISGEFYLPQSHFRRSKCNIQFSIIIHVGLLIF